MKKKGWLLFFYSVPSRPVSKRMKTVRHDITRIHEFGTIIEKQFGREGLEEYIGHIHDDIKSKFEAVAQEFERKLMEALNYFGIKS